MIKLFILFGFIAVQEVAANMDSNNLLASRKFCGYQLSDDYPRFTDVITLGEFPWTAQLLYDNNKLIQCTGSLINRRYILTAAHCLDNPLTKLIGIRLGDFNITSDKDCVNDERFGMDCSDPTEEFEIEGTLQHPAFNQFTSAFDIGLIRLTKEVTYSDYIRPICLPRSTILNLTNDSQLSTTGWGYLGEGLNRTEVKKKVITTLVPTNNCISQFPQRDVSITESHLCAKENDAFTCQGDSGAPLMNSVRHQWEQVGILIFKGNCGSTTPAVYTKVSSYLHWIIAVLRP